MLKAVEYTGPRENQTLEEYLSEVKEKLFLEGIKKAYENNQSVRILLTLSSGEVLAVNYPIFVRNVVEDSVFGFYYEVSTREFTFMFYPDNISDIVVCQEKLIICMTCYSIQYH